MPSKMTRLLAQADSDQFCSTTPAIGRRCSRCLRWLGKTVSREDRFVEKTQSGAVRPGIGGARSAIVNLLTANRGEVFVEFIEVEGDTISDSQIHGALPIAFSRAPGPRPASPRHEPETLDDSHRTLIASADTFFAASYVDSGNRRQVDVSHRGGKAGFVWANADGSLTIPDFAGNLYFSALNNILVTGRAGLCFPDFETGAMLQVSGPAEVILDSPEIALFQGAERVFGA